MHLEILTPEKNLYTGNVYGIQLPGMDGLFEVLDKHAPLVSALGYGTIKIIAQKNQEGERYTISGGFVEVLENKTTVLIEKIIQ